MFEFLNVDDVRIEAKRYLGHVNDNGDFDIDMIINKCFQRAIDTIKPRSKFQKFLCLNKENSIFLDVANMSLDGEDIKRHFLNVDSVYIMVATLGIESEKLLNKLSVVSKTEFVVMDAVLTAIIEKFCDKIDLDIQQIEDANGKNTTTRFSPGYGDLPLSLQKPIIRCLKADKELGLSLQKSNLIVPQKTVTAFIGVIDKNKAQLIENKKACSFCKTCENNFRCKYYEKNFK